jgi:hypothetical protein
VVVEHNTASGNAVGVLVQIVPGLPATVTDDVRVADNELRDDTGPNPVTDPDDLLSLIPAGIGLLNVGGDHVTVEHDTITGDPSAGLVVISLPAEVASADPGPDPTPDNMTVRQDRIAGKGRHPDPTRPNPLAGYDVAWDATGTGNCFSLGPHTADQPTGAAALHATRAGREAAA